jgi:hypothetical protein
VTIMGAIAGIFLWFGHVVMPLIILGLATLFVLLAVLVPAAYVRKEAFFVRFAHGCGVGLTYLLLLPFYWICFVPARVILRLRGKDPMRRAFPAPDASCWHARAPSRGKAFYRRQYGP